MSEMEKTELLAAFARVFLSQVFTEKMAADKAMDELLAKDRYWVLVHMLASGQFD